ncbi:unnamed protein product [Didymodactylos carnosus]|uniref:Uncharacterized protein n=1 Tax=Didymodactylos carnosus TaxID=1234261 RepID=A0A8S2FNF0_9BILA|nr:unnamed protein product [Didymodactylos carnosus]CAF4300164.1 unnamed protein product [Didymodactylos carnosus]
MSTLAKQRWKMLGEILLNKNIGNNGNYEDISVMRFKTYDFYTKTLNYEEEDESTWCTVEFSIEPDLKLNIRLCSTRIGYEDLIGFNNTGNTCK